MSAKSNLKLLSEMSRHEAVAYVVATIMQLRDEGIPFEVGHHEDKIYVLLEGFVMAEDGTITEPEKVQS